MFLPWSYDVSMLGSTILYATTGVLGHQIWKVKLPGDYSAGLLIEAFLYAFIYLISFPVTINTIMKSYKERTGKMKPFTEAIRPMISYVICFLLCVAWAAGSRNGVLEADVRAFFYLSGTIYANMSCRLIIAQMSDTRSEAINYLLLPLSGVVAACLLLPLSKTAEMSLLYGLAVFATLVHVALRCVRGAADVRVPQDRLLPHQEPRPSKVNIRLWRLDRGLRPRGRRRQRL